MNVLLDANILGRSLEPGHSQHQTALAAIKALIARGDTPSLVPQVLYELWVVATRPKNVNGLGLTSSQASAELVRLQGLFPLLPDTPTIFARWTQIVTTHSVIGKNAHDARLVAAMAEHGLTALLTFNGQDFTRYSTITVIDPASLTTPPAP